MGSLIGRIIKGKRQETAEEFGSYEEAARASGCGYSDTDLAEYTWLRQGPLFDEPAPLRDVPWYGTAGLFGALPLAGRDGKPIRVLDFGGSTGTHFLLATRFYGQIPIEKWAVVETPALVSRSAEKRTETLRWFSEISDATEWLGACDLVFTSGALQYTPDPSVFLRHLMSVGAPVFAVQRCALSLSGRAVTIVQRSRLSENARGPMPDGYVDCEIRYPVTYRAERDFMEDLQRSYRHIMQIRNDREVVIAGHKVRSDTVICTDPRSS